MVNIRAKFEVSSLNRSPVMEGSENYKIRSSDPSRTRFDLLLNFYRYLKVNIDAKFEVLQLEPFPRYGGTLFDLPLNFYRAAWNADAVLR